MKKFLIVLAIALSSQISLAAERSFRIDRYYPTVDGYAIAWGIPGMSIDFEKLDQLSSDEIENTIDIGAIRNFIVDMQTNQILTTLINDDAMVVFNVGDVHYGNHYSVGIEKLAILNVKYDVDTIAVIENYKWFNELSKILLVDRSGPVVKTVELDGNKTMEVMRRKLELSILPSNMELFKKGAENINEVKTDFQNGEQVNIISFDYSFPKQDRNALQVTATVKMKYENGVVTPYILKVEQSQY